MNQEAGQSAQQVECAKDMLSFIEKSPSCFHVIENMKQELTAAGFQELKEEEDWCEQLGQKSSGTLGGKYFVIRNDSSMIAFEIPEVLGKVYEEVKGFHIVAAHSDSPTFKIKECSEISVEENYIKLNTEKYGGMILSTWFDRALSVAGRVVVKENESVCTKLIRIDQDLCVIPSVAIHMNRDCNKGMEYNPQIDMLPLMATVSKKGQKNTFAEMIAKEAGVLAEDVLGQDLFLYVRDKGRILGEKEEFVLSPKLDDLQCVYAGYKAFLAAKPKQYINVCAVFDNEEVGSGTRQGADSTFLSDVLERIAEGLKVKRSGFLQWVAGSFLISADNAHAVHPNHPEKADPLNRPYLNKGIVIKYHGSQKYATDAVSAAEMKLLCKKANVPYQVFANRSDMQGGSTLGNISTAHVSLKTVDIGLPQLAMHSAVETGGTKDTFYALEVLKVFWSI